MVKNSVQFWCSRRLRYAQDRGKDQTNTNVAIRVVSALQGQIAFNVRKCVCLRGCARKRGRVNICKH